mgnify:CR=1 FL=1
MSTDTSNNNNNLVKIVGYAKKDFFDNGIEYRNFSPDLVGQQFASDEGTPIFTSGNFNISTNLDSKVDKNFITNPFSNFISLDTLNLDDGLEAITTRYSKHAKLNLDYTDMLNYAQFGSLKEYIRVSLENIIINWAASLYITEVSQTDTTITGDTTVGYGYTLFSNTCTFQIETDRINNPFEINYIEGGTIVNTFNESNPLRDLILNYSSYVISNKYGDFPIVDITGATGLTGSFISLIVEGNAFPNDGSETLDYHVKPNANKFEEFFLSLNQFENNLLNRLTIPAYTGKFKVYNETETGAIVETFKELTWPVSDGYNLDFNTIDYTNYVSELLSIATINDNSKSDLMVRFLVSTSISEFDSIPDINGTYSGSESGGQKMTSTLKVYGREFDEINDYITGISFANVVTYDKKNNTPDAVVKNLARVLGWQLTTSITEIDVLDNFLNLNPNYYDGYSRGYSDAEVEIELWRRIVLNTPWLWKSKGTRKAIEFLFKFIGAPDGLVTFNEHLYVANDVVDIELIIEMMEYFNGTNDISGLNFDADGYPLVLPDTPEMYFQKAGLWYRTTGGPSPDIDILKGNNPHIGPYDGGQAYIDQFTDCLIPNYEDCNSPTPSICDGYTPTGNVLKNWQVFSYSGGTTVVVPSVECCFKHGFIDDVRSGVIHCVYDPTSRRIFQEATDTTIIDPCIGTGFTLNEVNLFTNYAIGTFDECCSSTKDVDIDTDQNFDGILTENINKILRSNPVTETGCTFTNVWEVTAYYEGESIYVNEWYTGATAPDKTQYLAELYNLSGTTELSAATFVDINDILTVSIDSDCEPILNEKTGKFTVPADEYLRIDLCISTDFNCVDETVTGLTGFNISKSNDDACSPRSALALDEFYYHNGIGSLPAVGDYVYYDINGLTPFVSGDKERFMGGDWTIVTNWLETDATGLMIEIICPIFSCLVTTGQGILNVINKSIDNNLFWVDGVTQLRSTKITYELFDVVATQYGQSVTATISDGFAAYQLTEDNPIISLTKDINPNGGSNSSGLYDYDAHFTYASSVVSFKVRMIVTEIKDECILGTNTQTISIGTNK